MPHVPLLMLQSEPDLLAEYAHYHAQRSLLQRDDGRCEVFDSRMADVLSNLTRLSTKTAQQAGGQDDISSLIQQTEAQRNDPQTPVVLHTPYDTILRAYRNVLATAAARHPRRLEETSDLRSIGLGSVPRTAASHEGSYRRGRLYWGRTY